MQREDLEYNSIQQKKKALTVLKKAKKIEAEKIKGGKTYQRINPRTIVLR